MTANNLTILGFLAMLAVTLLGGARIAIWLYSESDRRVDEMVRDALDDPIDDWRKDEWWR